MIVVALVLVAFGAALIIGQDVAALAAARRLRRDPAARGYSSVPLVGPAICVAGLLLAGARGWVVAAPFVLDVGTFALIFGLPSLIRELGRSR